LGADGPVPFGAEGVGGGLIDGFEAGVVLEGVAIVAGVADGSYCLFAVGVEDDACAFAVEIASLCAALADCSGPFGAVGVGIWS
jgi:hypothetical protein